MRKKTSPITFFSDPSQSSTLSFHSLFQRSSDSTPEDESNLIHLMYNAFRCGAFDDPSVGSHEDWDSLFEHYNFHWRRCSLQGAIADESTRQSFQRICRSFASDDATERLLFSLHTAETVDDLRHILELQREIGHADAHDGDTLESVSDAMWGATTCILRLFTVFEAKEKISSLCAEARQIAKRWETLGSFAGKGIAAVLTKSRECWAELVEEINHTSRPQRYPIEDVWNGSEYDDLNSIAIVSYSGETVSKMLGVPEVKGQKSEKLLQRIIQAHTAPGELVMDLFAGTGTTAAAAHKMGRRYIVMEQMDYVRTTTVERLKKVIGGEQSGISRAENWKGGGSFVFCQLHRRNAALAVEIQGAGAREELEALWARMRESGLISCLADPEEFSPDDPDWAALTLEEQKRALLALLDKNQLYVSRWDLEDGEAGLTAADRAFTRSVYGEG